MLAQTGVMAGARSWTAPAQWASAGRHKVGLCGPPPSLWTFRRVLCTVDVAAVEAALSAWVLGRRLAAARAAAEAARAAGRAGPRSAERVVVACDGKTVRGSRTKTGAATALLGVFERRHRLVLTRRAISDGNEIAAFASTLDCLPDRRDVLGTADALATQREHAAYLHGRGAHDLVTVTRNQPTLYAALAALPWAQVHRQRCRQSGHGRTETRSIAVLAPDGAPGIDALFPTPPESCESSGPVPTQPPESAPGRSSTRSPSLITAKPTPDSSPAGCRITGASRTASTTCAT
jgi:hypothetical protein